jgi:hypothetical protein
MLFMSSREVGFKFICGPAQAFHSSNFICRVPMSNAKVALKSRESRSPFLCVRRREYSKYSNQQNRLAMSFCCLRNLSSQSQLLPLLAMERMWNPSFVLCAKGRRRLVSSLGCFPAVCGETKRSRTVGDCSSLV